ncbi:hypothetical protein MLD38_013510 [Melastoma candidum]|uniref:Uncharacterized protein n=1 Tax=Melastoma candidum TaxID=119954 RepID=A0ACB9RE05_9MYRT|nr:hypothetical protein MLD38_013510 [Melastoma candidum]
MGEQKELLPSTSLPKRITMTLRSLFDQDVPSWSMQSSPIPSPCSSSCISSPLINKESPRRRVGSGGKTPNSSLSPVPTNDDILSLISYCSFVFTFTDPAESSSQQDSKRLKLNQLLYHIKYSRKPIDDELVTPIMSMLSANIFRPLPAPSHHLQLALDLPDDEETIATAYPNWPHLQIVYNILLRIIMNNDPEKLRPHVDRTFLLNLLALFQSEDPRERESLKNIYHLIYSKFTFHRSFLRWSMNDVLLQYAFECERHCGIGEILEIWGSIINGFTVPLKKEHKLFLMRVLIPMHKPKCVAVYHKQLSYCVLQLVQKEPMLVGVVVRGILRHWPMANSQKEVLLISELEELVDNIEPDQYRRLALPLCTHFTRCMNSWNAQVAEQALYVWNNEQFVKMVSLAMEEVFPIVVKGVEMNLKWHWSNSVMQLTENLKEMLVEMDTVLYYKCVTELNLRRSSAAEQADRRKERWERIESLAAGATDTARTPSDTI